MPTSDLEKATLRELIMHFDKAGGILTAKEIKAFLGVSSQNFRQKWLFQRKFYEVEPGKFRLSDRILKQRTVLFNGGVINRPEQYITLTPSVSGDWEIPFKKRMSSFQTLQNLVPKGEGIHLYPDNTYTLHTHPCRFLSSNPSAERLIWEVGLTPEVLMRKLIIAEGQGTWEAAHHYRGLLEHGSIYSKEVAEEVAHSLTEKGFRRYEVIFEGTKYTANTAKTIAKNVFNYGLLPAAMVLSAVNIAEAAQESPKKLHKAVMDESREWTSVAIGGGIGVVAGGLAAGICTGPVIPLVVGAAFAIGGTEASRPVLDLLEKTVSPLMSRVAEGFTLERDLFAHNTQQRRQAPTIESVRSEQSRDQQFSKKLQESLSQLSKIRVQYQSPTMTVAEPSRHNTNQNLQHLVKQAFSPGGVSIASVYQEALTQLPSGLRESIVPHLLVQQKTLFNTSSSRAVATSPFASSIDRAMNVLLEKQGTVYESKIRALSGSATFDTPMARHFSAQAPSSQKTLNADMHRFFTSSSGLNSGSRASHTNQLSSAAYASHPVTLMCAPHQREVDEVSGNFQGLSHGMLNHGRVYPWDASCAQKR